MSNTYPSPSYLNKKTSEALCKSLGFGSPGFEIVNALIEYNGGITLTAQEAGDLIELITEMKTTIDHFEDRY